jgi:hypothetical protein
MKTRFVKVTAHLISPVALSPEGEAPHLDAICELVLAQHTRSIAASSNGNRHLLDVAKIRGQEVSAQGQLPIPIVREKVDGIPVPRCSFGIMEKTQETAEHYHCAFPIERAIEVSEKERIQIRTTGGVYKSVRLPLRLSTTSRIVWFAELRESPCKLRKLVNQIETLGKKSVYGYGRVSEWTVEETDIDASWFHGGVLMRALPISVVSDDIQGKRRSYGAVAGPYWQRSFFVDRYVPY